MYEGIIITALCTKSQLRKKTIELCMCLYFISYRNYIIETHNYYTCFEHYYITHFYSLSGKRHKLRSQRELVLD